MPSISVTTSGARFTPAPLVFAGQRLPASYANFYMANDAAIVPTFNDPADRIALGVLAELIRDQPVVGIHAVDLVWGLGRSTAWPRSSPRRVTPRLRPRRDSARGWPSGAAIYARFAISSRLLTAKDEPVLWLFHRSHADGSAVSRPSV